MKHLLSFVIIYLQVIDCETEHKIAITFSIEQCTLQNAYKDGEAILMSGNEPECKAIGSERRKTSERWGSQNGENQDIKCPFIIRCEGFS